MSLSSYAFLKCIQALLTFKFNENESKKSVAVSTSTKSRTKNELQIFRFVGPNDELHDMNR